jgi:outer membrane protein TolC
VALLAAEGYVNLQAAQAHLASRQEMRALARSLYDVTLELIRAGRLAASAEVPESVVLSMREQDVQAAEIDLQRAQSALAQAIDSSGEEPLLAAEPLKTDPPSVQATEIGELASDANPEVLAKKRELELHEIDLSVRKNQALPDLRLRAAAGVTGQAGAPQCAYGYYLDGVTPCAVPATLDGGPGAAALSSLKARFYFYEVGLTFSMPLERAPDNRSIEAAEIAIGRSRHEYEHTRLLARSRAEESARAIVAMARVLEETRRSVTLANHAVVSAKESYLLGKSTVFDLIKAQDLLAQTRDRELAISHRLAVEDLRLRALTGRLLAREASASK